MRASRKAGLGASLVGLVAAGLVSVAVPAQAYTNPLQCDSEVHYVSCNLVGYYTGNERWYFNDVYYPAGDNQSVVSFRCTPYTWVGIYITYTGGDGYGAAGNSAYCGLVQQ
jgi:hypothetical protein